MQFSYYCNVKSLFNVFLATILIISSIGVSFSKHYCMGRLVEVSMGHDKHSCEGMMGLETESGCCEDSLEQFILEDEFQNVSFDTDLHGIFFELRTIELNDLLPANNLSSSHKLIFKTVRPPGSPPIYVSVESFLL